MVRRLGRGPAAAVLRVARTGATPDNDTRPTFALYLAAMLLRNRLIRHRMDEAATHTGPALVLMELMKKDGISFADLTPALVTELDRRAHIVWTLMRQRQDPDEKRLQQLRIMLRKIDEHAQQFEPWHFTVEEAEEEDFITSDTAVATIEPRPRPGWRGLLPPGAILAIPVSPRRAIIASEALAVGANPGHAGIASTVINQHIMIGSFDAIFRHPTSTWPPATTLASGTPSLPNPTRTLRASAPGNQPTFPATYPKVRNLEIRDLLDKLGAVDEVE